MSEPSADPSPNARPSPNAPVSTDAAGIARAIVDAALAQGFVRAAITRPTLPERAAEQLATWLSHGHHGEMGYMAGALNRAAPVDLLPTTQSVLVVALPYADPVPVPLRSGATGAVLTPALRGRVARYAQGEDYHRVLKLKLERVAEGLERWLGRGIVRRACVDSAPLLERDFAIQAGLGFAAKSTLTIVPGAGSFVLLGELLLELELPPTASAVQSGCGTCTRCLDACPTRAFVGPYQLDARRCISYLTIELKGSVPRELRPLIGQHVFGCDICQEVCPWNHTRHLPARDAELGRREALSEPDLVELLFLGSAAYRRLVAGTALSRVSRARLSRNAAIALGNSRSPEAEAPLARALSTHTSELVRAHAAWALGALGFSSAVGRAALEQAAVSDESPEVREEALAAQRALE